MLTINRRNFIKSASLLPFCAAAKPKGSAVLKISLNAYSFNNLLNDSIKGRGAGATLIEVLEFAAKNKFDGIDATGYYFPAIPQCPPMLTSIGSSAKLPTFASASVEP